MSKNVGALVGLAALGVATGGFGLVAGAGADAAAGAGLDAVAGAGMETAAGSAAYAAGTAGTMGAIAGTAGAATASGGMLSSIGSGIKATLPYAQGVSAAASLIGAITARRPGGLPTAPTPSPTPLLANPSDAAIQSQQNAMIAALVARGGRQSTILTSPASGTQLGG